MNLTVFFLTAAFLNVSAIGVSQNVTFSGKNVSLEKVFSAVKQQTGYLFLYEDKDLAGAKSVSIQATHQPLLQFLEVLFEGQPLRYSVRSKTINIFPSVENNNISPLSRVFTDNSTSSNFQYADSITLRGKITNEDGEPMPGVSIQVQGTKAFTTTNQDGEFELPKVNNNSILLITATNIIPKKYFINGKMDVDIVVEKSVSDLQTVVVNKGYYTTSQANNTGSVSTLRAKDIQKQPVGNIMQALQGRIPGLLVTEGSGMPGSPVTVQLRGTNSIDNGNTPLYIIDGVPFQSGMSRQGFLGLADNNPLSYINPYSIESVEVLKDADATAIYGSRGANGVILITTKKGRSGKPKLGLNVYAGSSAQASKVNFLNTPQYLAMRNEAFAMDTAVAGPADYDLNGEWDTTRYTNWRALLADKSSSFYDAQLSLSGGADLVQYHIGAGYHKESPPFWGNFSNRKTMVNTSFSISNPSKKLSVQLTTNFTSDKNSIPQFDPSATNAFSPVGPPLYDANGKINWQNSTWSNPVVQLMKRYETNVTNLLANANIKYRLTDEFSVSSSFGYNFLQGNEWQGTPIQAKDPQSFNGQVGSAAFSNTSFKSYIVEPQLNYAKKIGWLGLDLLVGGTYQGRTSENATTFAEGYTKDELLRSLTGGATFTVSSSISEYKYAALYGKANVNLWEKYILNFTARRDGTSRFGPENRYNTFYSSAFAWIFSKEHFIQKHLPILSFGKIRSSYGTTGSDQVGDYRYYDLYLPNLYPYQSSIGLYPTGFYNPYLAWERSKKYEIGLELGLFSNKLFITSNYFINNTDNQLLKASLPNYTGFNNVQMNLDASIRNAGFEFSLSSVNISTAAFQWKTTANFTRYQNKLTRFPGLDGSVFYSSFFIGKPLTSRRVFAYNGVDPQTGLYSFLDKEGKVTSSPMVGTDDTRIMDTDPDFFGGLQNTFTYKGFELDIFAQVLNQVAVRPAFLNNASPGASTNVPQFVYNNRWKGPGDHAQYQRLTAGSYLPATTAYNAVRNSDFLFQRNTYVRISNVSLSYRFNQSVLRKIGLDESRIYVQGRDLFTFAPSKGMDPETRSYYVTAPLRVITLGIQLSL